MSSVNVDFEVKATLDRNALHFDEIHTFIVSF